MEDTYADIVWTKSPTKGRGSPLADMLLHVGVPGANRLQPRDEAIALLQAAAEVEHALLLEYPKASSIRASIPNFHAGLTRHP